MAAPPPVLVVVGVNNTEQSYYALECALDRFFTPNFASSNKLIIVYARSPSAIGVSERFVSGFAKTIEAKSTEICLRKMEKHIMEMQVIIKEVVGEPETVLCKTVEEHDADWLVLGSNEYHQGRETISEKCGQNLKCPVMVVRQPTN